MKYKIGPGRNWYDVKSLMKKLTRESMTDIWVQKVDGAWLITFKYKVDCELLKMSVWGVLICGERHLYVSEYDYAKT